MEAAIAAREEAGEAVAIFLSASVKACFSVVDDEGSVFIGDRIHLTVDIPAYTGSVDRYAPANYNIRKAFRNALAR